MAVDKYKLEQEGKKKKIRSRVRTTADRLVYEDIWTNPVGTLKTIGKHSDHRLFRKARTHWIIKSNCDPVLKP